MEEVRVPTVAAIIRDPRGAVLLQLRDDAPGISYPDHWTLPGGLMEPGETPNDAIRREVWEEIAIAIPLTHWKTYDRPHRGVVPAGMHVTVVQHVFIGRTGLSLAAITCNEGRAVAFHAASAIAALPVAFDFASLLDEYFTVNTEGTLCLA